MKRNSRFHYITITSKGTINMKQKAAVNVLEIRGLIPRQIGLILSLGSFFLCMAAEALPGYVLLSPYYANRSYLISTTGDTAFTWKHQRANAYGSFLLDNGNLLRPTESTKQGLSASAVPNGLIQEIDRNGNVVWEFEYKSDQYVLHHGIWLMPNGNILASAFEKKTKAELQQAGITRTPPPPMFGGGRDESLLFEQLIEIDPRKPKGQEIVWMWKIWDHLVSAGQAYDNPHLFSTDLESPSYQSFNDWMHLNGIAYNPDLDQIVFSSRVFSEVYIIDHSTTTEEAAGHTGGRYGKGGDILYRWGNTSNYKRSGGIQLKVLHSPSWVPNGYPGAGNIIFFHNNENSNNSQIIEITPPLKQDGTYEMTNGIFGPEQPTWIYQANGFYSQMMSSCQRLPNGNTFIFEASSGRMREVDQNGTVLWQLGGSSTGPGFGFDNNLSAKAMKYEMNHPGIQKLLGIASKKQVAALKLKPVQILCSSGKISISHAAGANAAIYSMHGKKLWSSPVPDYNFTISTDGFSAGTYIVSAVSKTGTFSRQINIHK